MKIEKIDLIVFRIPMKEPFRISGGSIDAKESILIKIYSEGLIGYGEASTLPAPFYLAEYTQVAYDVLEKFICPQIIGKDFLNLESLLNEIKWIKGYNFAQTAVENAYWDLLTQKQNKSLATLLGGEKKQIEVGESLGIKNCLKGLLKEVELRLSEGYKRIKLKIKQGWDIDPVKAVRESFGKIPLMVDANSAYSLKDLNLFKELDQYELMMIEQPLGFDDLTDHAFLQKQLKTPICLDESVISVEHARKALELGSCRIINIKTARVGGVLASKQIHDLCLEYNIPVWSGGMMESSIGRFFNLSLASLSNYSLPADMSPMEMHLLGDLTESSYKVVNGLIDVPSFLHQDYRPSNALIKKHTIHSKGFSC